MSRFLLVDDEPATLAPLAVYLRRAGHEVVQVTAGTDAMDETRGLELGATLFLRKPMPLQRLTVVLEATAEERATAKRPASSRQNPSGPADSDLREYDRTLIQRLEAHAEELWNSNRVLTDDLAERELLFHLVMDSVPVGLAFLDRRSLIEEANAGYWALLGQPADDESYRRLPDLLPEATYHQLVPASRQALAGHATRVEIAHRRDDGEVRSLEIRFSPQVDRREILGLVMLADDITARKEAESVLEQYRESIEVRVQERTIELRQANRELRRQMAERIQAEAALSTKTLALQEVLDTVQTQKQEQAERFAENVERQVLPLLQTLEDFLPTDHRVLVTQIRKGLDEVTTSTGDRMTRLLGKLTPTEVRMVNHIRRGLAVKEIARLEHLAPATISRHRHNIRRKLGLLGRKVNLESFLAAESAGK